MWSFVCAYVIILLVFWKPERRTVFQLLSVPVWLALLFHVVTVFGLFRVPVILTVLVLVAVSVASSFGEAKTASAGGKNSCIKMFFLISQCVRTSSSS